MSDFDDTDEIDGLDRQIQDLEQTMAAAAGVTATFQAELRHMETAMVLSEREVGTLSRSIGGDLRKAFDGLVFDGMRLSEALDTVAMGLVDTVYNMSMQPVTDAAGGAMANGVNALLSGLLAFEKGGVFSGGRVTPFARGGVVSSPTSFPMRSGTGLMGEAGPEAIMPLTRGADGRLGVSAAGGGRPVVVTMNVSTPDVQGFQRSQTQIATQLNRALARGQRNR